MRSRYWPNRTEADLTDLAVKKVGTRLRNRKGRFYLLGFLKLMRDAQLRRAASRIGTTVGRQTMILDLRLNPPL